MTKDRARMVIRDLAYQDHGGETGGRKPTAEATIAGWYRGGAEAGDLGVCEAIDTLGADEAARVYEAEWTRLARADASP